MAKIKLADVRKPMLAIEREVEALSTVLRDGETTLSDVSRALAWKSLGAINGQAFLARQHAESMARLINKAIP